MIFNGKKEMFKEIRIDIFGLRDICKHFNIAAGLEVGGVMYGKSFFDKVMIESFIPVKNTFPVRADAVDKYRADESDMKRLRHNFVEQELKGRRFLGEYHSHPSGSILPSDKDVENIYTHKIKKENYILGIITGRKAGEKDLKELQTELFSSLPSADFESLNSELIYDMWFYCFHWNYSNYKTLGGWRYNTYAERLFMSGKEFRTVQFVKRLKQITNNR